MTDFTRLSVDEIHAEIQAIARDVQAVFGGLSAPQLNWKPEPSRWSVAQCLDHLLTLNALMVEGMRRALAPGARKGLVQRLPGVPGMLGRVMVRALSPTSTRKLPAPASGRPTTSDLGADIVARFVQAQAGLGDELRSTAARDLAAVTMVSPFASVVAYSLLDAWRLIVAHERRHLEQARRVTQAPGFPH